MPDQLYSAEEAASILGLQVRTVRNYVRDGRLPGVRIGKQYRIAQSELEAFTSGGSLQQSATGAVADGRGSAEVSSVVQLEGITPASRERLERTVAAAMLAGGGQGGPQLHAEPSYDESGGRLKLIIVGPLREVADLLRVVDALARAAG